MGKTPSITETIGELRRFRNRNNYDEYRKERREEKYDHIFNKNEDDEARK